MKFQLKKTKWIVKIFEGARVLVKEGDLLKKGDIILTSEKKIVKSYDASIVLSKISKNKLYEFIQNWQGKEVNEGELLFEEKGLFSKNFFSFCSGTFVGVDEFYNVCIEERSSGEKRETYSPIEAKVLKVDQDTVDLEFKAVEFIGEGIREDKVWGESFFKEINKISEINYSLENKVIITSNFETAFVTKAEVVGVKALVIDKENKNEFENIETDLSILALDKNDIEKLISNFGGESRNVLLNSKTGRLLIIIEQKKDEEN